MYEQDFFLEVLDWLTKYADHEPDWADACLAILSGRDKMDLRPGVPNNVAPAERDGHSLSGQVDVSSKLRPRGAPVDERPAELNSPFVLLLYIDSPQRTA